MEKLIQEHRRRFGDFEVIDFVDEKEIERMRAQLDVAVPMELHWTWEYGSEVAELRVRSRMRGMQMQIHPLARQ